MHHSRRALVILAPLTAALACTGRSPPSETHKENRVSQPSPPSPAGSPTPTGSPTDCTASLRVGAPSADGVTLTATLHNGSGAAVQLLQSTRMPYVIVE